MPYLRVNYVRTYEYELVCPRKIPLSKEYQAKYLEIMTKTIEERYRENESKSF
jgi:hypothetical protein